MRVTLDVDMASALHSRTTLPTSRLLSRILLSQSSDIFAYKFTVWLTLSTSFVLYTRHKLLL